MSVTRTGNTGFEELAVNPSDEHAANTIPVLIDILKDMLHIDFDSSLAWVIITPTSCFVGFCAHECDATRLGIT